MKPMRVLCAMLLLCALVVAPLARAGDRAQLDRDAAAALKKLTDGNASARLLAGEAKAILVFPSIVKAGLMFGGQFGDGTLLRGGKPVAHYNSVAASYGLQAGVQVFGYALFLMKDSALGYLDKSEGWELGVGPTIVVVDAGVGKALTTTTGREDVYAFIFDQQGLMAGLGIQGSKITKLDE